MKSTRSVVQTGLWRRCQGTGLERFELQSTANEWLLCGTIIALEDHIPIEARYEIVCDRQWFSRSADVTVRQGQEERSLRLTVEDGHWYANNESIAGLKAVDIDLEWSPSTNTLPLRRLQLSVGEMTEPITAAWIRFPQLTVEPLHQTYRRISSHQYIYSSHHGSFVAEVAVAPTVWYSTIKVRGSEKIKIM